jgi:hypothetical protein
MKELEQLGRHATMNGKEGVIISNDLEGVDSPPPEQPFPDKFAAEVYALRHGLRLALAGSSEFAKWQRVLPPDAFTVYTYRSKRAVKTCGMYSQRYPYLEVLAECGAIELNYDGTVRVLDEKELATWRYGLVGKRASMFVEEKSGL